MVFYSGVMMDATQDVMLRLEQLERLRDKIANARSQADQLPELEREYKAMHGGIIKTLEQIDVAERSNMGWESRIVAFLQGIRVHAATRSI
jgi:hypothetical protein